MLNMKLLISILLIGMIGNAFAKEAITKKLDEMAQPKAVENKMYDAMVGTWQAKDTVMMGEKMNQVTKIRWMLNHQYIIMEVKATESSNLKSGYEGIGILGVDSTGKAKAFWFDNWGVDAMSTGTGEFINNKLIMTDSNADFKETRTFEIKGKEMIMHAKGFMIVDHKKVPFDVTTVFKKR